MQKLPIGELPEAAEAAAAALQATLGTDDPLFVVVEFSRDEHETSSQETRQFLVETIYCGPHKRLQSLQTVLVGIELDRREQGTVAVVFLSRTRGQVTASRIAPFEGATPYRSIRSLGSLKLDGLLG